jgi:hypothetical protein
MEGIRRPGARNGLCWWVDFRVSTFGHSVVLGNLTTLEFQTPVLR